MSTRLLYLVSHPIQYQAPLLRLIASQPDIELTVCFDRVPEGASYDPGFARAVDWDVPLLEGYRSFCLAADSDVRTAIAGADVLWLHGWESRRFRHVLRTAAKMKLPVLMRGENWDRAMPDGFGPRGWAKRVYLKRIFSACSAFLAIGSKNREYYLRHGISPERIFDTPYAVDNHFFARKADAARPGRAAMALELGLAPEKPIVLFAAKLIARKRLDLLIKAASALSADIQLLVVGDGPLRSGLEQLAPRARFVGFRNQSEMPAFYALADVFVLPSEREPWGLAVNEAMACGTAVIASDDVGAAYDLIDQTCGRIVRSGDAQDLASAIRVVLANAPEMGLAARRRIAAWDFHADLRGLRQALVHVTAGVR